MLLIFLIICYVYPSGVKRMRSARNKREMTTDVISNKFESSTMYILNFKLKSL